jgi:hypothetical protein
MQEDKPPARWSLKACMINLLKNKRIPVNGTVHKVGLYMSIAFNKPREINSGLTLSSLLSVILYSNLACVTEGHMKAKTKHVFREKNVTEDLKYHCKGCKLLLKMI